MADSKLRAPPALECLALRRNAAGVELNALTCRSWTISGLPPGRAGLRLGRLWLVATNQAAAPEECVSDGGMPHVRSRLLNEVQVADP